jgi:hypothetical protein
LEGAIAKLPEVYTEAVTPETVEQYTKLLSALSEEAQWWITGMGWGLEDLALDANEVALLELLAEKNVPTGMSILTSPDVIDGVKWGEVTRAQGYEVDSLAALLKDDIDELLAEELLSDEGLAGINELIEMAGTNFEIAKGLYLIDNFGHPNAAMFTHQVPEYNTQLHVLGRLLELGVPEGYEVAAVAAGLDYGSLWTMADEDVRTLIPDYAHRVLGFQAETDDVLRQGRLESNGGKTLFRPAAWQASDLPLEAQIALIWGAPGNYYSMSKEEAARIGYDWDALKVKLWVGYREVFSGRPMSLVDFDFLFVDLSTLEAISAHLLSNDFLKDDLNSLSGSIYQFAMNDNLDYIWPEELELVKTGGREVYNGYVCNMDWQWGQFKNFSRFVGGSGDAYIHTYFLKSVNVAGITPVRNVHQSGYYDCFDHMWKASDREIQVDPGIRGRVDSRLGWNKVPWSNWHINPHPGNWTGRMRILTPLRGDVVWSTGIPHGYILRGDVSDEAWPDMP